jgi:asparagine synthase (glutamine-hydrolysing)
VPPGHFLVATERSSRLVRYWDFDYPAAESLAADGPSEREHTERLYQLLDEAVRLRLRADVPVGCYLSGGLDSCAVLGLAASQSSTPVDAFTVTFEDAAYDEGRVASEMAAYAGARLHPISVTDADLADHFADATWHAETLCSNGHGVSKYLLSRAVRKAGIRAVLTGEGADEVLGGYAHFRRDNLLYLPGQLGTTDLLQQPKALTRPRSRQVNLSRCRAKTSYPFH